MRHHDADEPDHAGDRHGGAGRGRQHDRDALEALDRDAHVKRFRLAQHDQVEPARDERKAAEQQHDERRNRCDLRPGGAAERGRQAAERNARRADRCGNRGGGDNRNFKIDTKGFGLANSSRYDVGDLRNTFTYGGDLFRDDVSNTDLTGNGEVTTPDGVRTVSGAFAQWKGNYSRRLEVIGALRFDNYELNSAKNHAEGSHLSPKGTVGITPVNGVTFYGTYAEGYRAPAVTETLVAGPHPPFAVGFPNLFTFVPNPDLRPEIGRTKEVGVNFKYDDIFFKGDRLRVKANVFRNGLKIRFGV